MTGNDLPRLLDAAAPEPRRALSADDLVRRARRRRTARASALTALTAVTALAGVAVATGLRGDTARRSVVDNASPAPNGTPGTPGPWPATDVPVLCPLAYPTGVTEYGNAFDGTVRAVRHGERTEIDLEVHHVYKGPPRTHVTLHTPADPYPAGSIVGFRVLALARDDLTLSTCGHTRPWNADDANAWVQAFERPDDCRIWSTLLYFPDAHEPDFVGLTVDDATALAETRGLSTRLVGDGVQAVTDDLRRDRVNLCNRKGVVTAAARY